MVLRRGNYRGDAGAEQRSGGSGVPLRKTNSFFLSVFFFLLLLQQHNFALRPVWFFWVVRGFYRVFIRVCACNSVCLAGPENSSRSFSSSFLYRKRADPPPPFLFWSRVRPSLSYALFFLDVSLSRPHTVPSTHILYAHTHMPRHTLPPIFMLSLMIGFLAFFLRVFSLPFCPPPLVHCVLFFSRTVQLS